MLVWRFVAGIDSVLPATYEIPIQISTLGLVVRDQPSILPQST